MRQIKRLLIGAALLALSSTVGLTECPGGSVAIWSPSADRKPFVEVLRDDTGDFVIVLNEGRSGVTVSNLPENWSVSRVQAADILHRELRITTGPHSEPLVSVLSAQELDTGGTSTGSTGILYRWAALSRGEYRVVIPEECRQRGQPQTSDDALRGSRDRDEVGTR